MLFDSDTWYLLVILWAIMIFRLFKREVVLFLYPSLFFPFFSLTYTMIWRWGRILVERKKMKSTAIFSLTLIYIHAPFSCSSWSVFFQLNFLQDLKSEFIWNDIIKIIRWCSRNQYGYLLIQWNDIAWFHKQWLVPQKSC